MTPKIDSQLTQLHSLRRSRRPHGPWSTSITDPHPHMLSRFWKRRIAMLARAPYRNQQSSFFHTLTFALFAIAIFALPMLNIVPVRTLLARDDKPAESSEADRSELVTVEDEEEFQNPTAPAAAADPSTIEEEDIEIRKITEAPKTVDLTEKPIVQDYVDFEEPVADPAKPVRKIPRGKRGFAGIVANEEVETTLDKPSPPQPEFIPAPTRQEQEILKKLDEIIDFPIDFKEETLQGVVDFLKLRFAIPIFIDLVAMEEVGLDRDTPAFDLSISNVDGHSILRLLLGRRQLGYCVEDGVLKITSQENLNTRQRLYIYPLADLVHSHEDLDEILDAVENTLRVRGMTGVFSVNASTRSLIATHSYTSHQEVLNLLRGLRQVAALSPSQPFSSTIGAGAIRHTPNTTAPTIRIEQEKERDLRNRLRTEESSSKTIRSGNDQNVQGGVEKQPLSGAIPKDSHVEQQKFTQLLMDPTFHPLVLVKEDGSQPVELLPFESVSPLGKDDEGVFLDKNERRMQIDLQRLLKHLLDQLELHQAVTKEFDPSSKTISPEVRLQKIYDEKVEQVLNDKRGLYHSSGRRFSNFSTLISLLDQLAAEIQNETDEVCSKIGKRQTLRSTVNGKPVPASPGDPK